MTQFAKVVFRHAANSGHRIAMLPERKLQTGMECTFQLAVAMNEAILFEVRWRAFTKGDEHLVAEGVSGTRANTGDGGLITVMFQPLLIDKTGDKPGDQYSRCAG